ncbi:LysR substrate binding domain protein [compost metagenome]
MGIVLIPGYVAAAAIRDRELVRVLPEVKAHLRKISVIYPSRRFLDAKVRTWIDFLKENLQKRQAIDELSLCGSSEA